MRKIKSELVAFLCLLTIMLVPAQTLFASETNIEYPTVPAMTFIADYAIDFGIVENTADVDVRVSGNVLDATRAKVIAELQVKNGNSWIPVAIWTDDQNNYEAWVDETHDVVSGHTYRVKGTFMVWEGDAYETEMSYSDEITA